MKALLVVAVLALVVVVLFVAGVFSPKRSRSMQKTYEDASKKAEGKSAERGGRVGDVTSAALNKARGAAEASARAGRDVNKKATE